MVAVPPPLPVTLPVLSTVAILSLLLNQVTFLLVASLGATVGVRVSVLLTEMVVEDLFNETPVTGTSTVTVHSAVTPSSVTAIILVVPPATGVTVPPLTVATVSTLLTQATVLYVALVGVTVAVKTFAPPERGMLMVLSLMDVVPSRNSIRFVFMILTVTVQFAFLVASLDEVAVMVAVPIPTPVTVQPMVVGVLGLTEATLGLLLLQMTFLFVALSGLTVAVRVSVLLT